VTRPAVPVLLSLVLTLMLLICSPRRRQLLTAYECLMSSVREWRHCHCNLIVFIALAIVSRVMLPAILQTNTQ